MRAGCDRGAWGDMAMSIDFIRPEVDELRPRISVIGVGGAGGNAIANMIARDVQGVDFIVANTDAQALNALARRPAHPARPRRSPRASAPARGPRSARPPPKRRSSEIEKALEGAHMCFIAAGMGGGTGTGAAPVIAKAARDRGILTVGVVTKPFSFEGNRRGRVRRGRHRRAAAACRHADRHPQPEPVPASPTRTRPSRKRSRWPTRCSSRACAGSPT